MAGTNQLRSNFTSSKASVIEPYSFIKNLGRAIDKYVKCYGKKSDEEKRKTKCAEKRSFVGR
jgi:hypothetical protein